ncbi:WecB/TagA/CpsF family glycosyltransferase [Demequina sp. NBRC 110051]|uniref:WecB/TagA/CpsF family glycosyltransferase n=1 Tax=Demequina sp. NBRC 110051 TaxID=1570340 RepID=UPI0009FD94EC|nr:WecB/TagA/CpsF family glycosyltransferase [Demequina sp. NBRC 110051]
MTALPVRVQRRTRLHVPVLDLEVAPVDAATIVAAITAREGWRIANHNLHSAYLTHAGEASMQQWLASADVVLTDGWPVWALARLRHRRAIGGGTRLGSSDWLDTLLTTDPAIRVVALGGSPESARRCAAKMGERSRRLVWTSYDGFEFAWQGGEEYASLDDALAAADLVLVGLGMPAQEEWILERLDSLPAFTSVANVGGTFDYYAGTQSRAPRWLGRIGLEWAYRLARNPARLWHRYLVEPWKLAVLLVRRKRRSPAPVPAARP